MPFPVALLLACIPQCTDPSPPAAGFAYDELLDYEMSFSDGETTNVVLRWPRDPAGSCGWPLIVFTHGLFGSRTSVAHLGREFAEAGYVTLTYDVRGHDTATGQHSLWGQRERLDLVELIRWAQGSFPGLVDPARTGLGGVSQGGILSFAGAAWGGLPVEPNPWITGTYPPIGAVVVENFAPDLGSAFAPDALGVHTSAAAALLTVTSVRFDPQLVAQAANALLNDDPAAWTAIVADPARDPAAHIGAMNTPLFAMAAWDDFWFPTETVVAALEQLPPGTPRRVYLGTGGHSTPPNDAERVQRNIWRREWFDRWLKGLPGSVDALPNYVYAVTPSDVGTYLDPQSQWEHAGSDSWPPAGTLGYRMYLSAGGELWPFEPKSTESTDMLTHQVAQGFGPQELVAAEFRWAQIESSVPLHSLSWQTRPLVAPLRFVGDPVMHLNVNTLSPRWQLAVTLWDVDPAGAARYITSGSTFGEQSAMPVLNGQVSVRLGSNAYEFPAGHSLRLSVQNLQLHQPPGGELLRYAPLLADFQVEIRHGIGEESWLELPVPDANTIAYGWSQTNSLGCAPIVETAGQASATAGAPFSLSARNLLNQTDGLLVYGFERAKKTIGGGGLLFVRSPFRRVGGFDSGGTPAPGLDCSGVFDYDFNARIQSGVDVALVPGARVFAQFWSRDPAAPATTNLTNAVEFSVFP